jgi:uncharacterized protein
MDTSKQREIASNGGKAAQAQGRAHKFTAEQARSAGRNGGETASRQRAHMATIGWVGTVRLVDATAPRRGARRSPRES